mgnify:CR=1 FL=1
MNRITAHFFMSAALAAVIASLPVAQAARAETLTIEECIETAHANNPELASLGYKQSGKNSALRLTKSQRMPKLSISETASRTNSPVMSFMSNLNQEQISMMDMSPARLNSPDAISNFNTNVSLQLPIYNGSKVSNAITMAQLDRQAASLEIERKKQEIKFNVVKAYYDVVLAMEHLKVTEDAYRTAGAHVKMARSHLDAGEPLKNTTAINYRKDDTPFWLEWNITPVHGPEGAIQHWVSVQRDVTKQRKRKKELREARELLDQVIETANIGICVTDQDGRFVRVNAAYTDLYGWTEDDLIGQPFTKVVPPDDRDWAQRVHDRFIYDEVDETTGEWTVQRKDGALRDVIVTAGRFVDEAGDRFKVTTVLDITERKRAEIGRASCRERVYTKV